ncbi:MAG: glycosyltransferase family 39 protein [Elusimicrobia bacterium]|nr:glycosyltransferase family 39 protein [Elusimicrobiota bacterium]
MDPAQDPPLRLTERYREEMPAPNGLDRSRRLTDRLCAVPERRWWAAVFLAALAVRLLWLAAWQAGGFTERYGYDAYVSIARFWLGRGPELLDATHPPLYPIWIAAVFSLIQRPSLLAIQLLNILMSCATCLFAGFWAERAASSRPLGRLAGLWAAFDPLLVFFAVQVQSEPFFLFVELIFFLALQRIGRAPSAASAFALGLLGGLASLARSVFGLFAPFLFISVFWPNRRERRAWLWLLLFAGWAVAPTLWGLRNLACHKTFIPLAVNGGWNLWEGFTLDREEVRRRPYEMGAEAARMGIDPSDAIACGDYFARKTKDFILSHPLQASRIIVGKFFLYWRPWPYDPHGPRVRAVLAVYFTLLFAFAAAGALSLRRLEPVWPAFALILYLSMLHSVFFTSLRYRSPIEPFLCVFAAAGALRLWERFSTKA